MVWPPKDIERHILRVLCIALVLMLLTQSNAEQVDHITLDYYPPGSLRYEYGGPQGAVVKGIQKYLIDIWEDSYYDQYENGMIDYFELQDRLKHIYFEIEDHRNGGKWWERRWWESFVESSGGAPRDPFTVKVGRTMILIDTDVFRISSDFKFKIRELEGTIDYMSDKIIDIGECKDFSGYGWKFKIAPKIKFGFSTSESGIGSLLKSIGIDVILTKYKCRKKWIKFTARAKYDFRENDAQFEICLDFPMWYNPG